MTDNPTLSPQRQPEDLDAALRPKFVGQVAPPLGTRVERNYTIVMGEISFPPEIRQWIATRLSEGYADEADYLIELILRDMAEAASPETPEEIAWVREKIAEGLASGVSDQDPFEFLAELRAGRHDGAS